MKRILLSVFAAAITAAMAVPALAADVDLSGQYRVRGDYKGNPSFVDANASQTTSQRVRLTATAQATDDTSVKVTIQDSTQWGSIARDARGGPAMTDISGGNELDVHEAFVNIDNFLGTPLALKVGRQELNYGDQRLIGSFGWDNNGRSFEAIKLAYKSDAANVDVFDAKITAAAGDNDQDLLGVYATVNTIPNNSLDLYALYLRDTSTTAFVSNATSVATGTIDETQSLTTLGARLKGNFDAVDYTAEIAYQTGQLNGVTNDLDIKALAYAVKAGYTLPTPTKIRVGAEYVFASGDDNLADNDIKTFSNLFPTNHGHMGYQDQHAWRNISAWSLNAKASGLVENLDLYAQYWNFSLAEEADAWYGAGNWMNAGTVSTGTRDGVGSELDITAKYKLNASTSVYAGISRYFAGDVIEDINTSAVSTKDRDYAFLQLTTNF